MVKDTIRLNSVLVLFTIANILNMIFPKGMGFEEQEGFEYELSKYTYGLCIVLMMPSLISSKRYYFKYMRYMSFYIILQMLIGFQFHYEFDLGYVLKALMICLSFVFFEDTLSKNVMKSGLLYAFLFSTFVNISYLVLVQNRLESAVVSAEEGHVGGGQVIANSIVHLLPLIFLLLRGKLVSYLYVFGFIVVLVSLRRTAILAYLLCLPFVYKQLKRNLSKRTIIISVIAIAFLIWYVVTNYWYIIEMRFSDMFEASNNGYYGSGRTGWWMALVENFYSSPFNWLQGFGLGQVTLEMAKAGFPFVHAHNDYIEIGYTYGLIGLFLWFGTFWKMIRLYKRRSDGGIILMASLSYLFIAFFSSSIYNTHLVCVAIFMGLVLNNQKGNVKKLRR